MENAFAFLQKAIADEVQKFQLQVNDALSVLQAENSRLKKELVEINIALFSREHSHLPHQAHEDKVPASLATPFEDIGQEPAVCTPRSPRASSPRSPRASSPPALDNYKTPSSNHVLRSPVKEECTSFLASFSSSPCRQPEEFESPSTRLCVMPARLLKTDQTKQQTQMPVQPAIDLPIQYLYHEDNSCGSALKNWTVLFAGIVRHTKSPKRLDPVVEVHNLSLWPFWLIKKRKPRTRSGVCRTASTRPQHTSLVARDGEVPAGAMMTNTTSWLQPFIVHPDHIFSMIYALMQGLMILYDVVDFPLLAFYSGRSEMESIVLVVSTSFWSLDMIFSFFQGFHSRDGQIEMRPGHIAHHYVRSWFLFDFVVVATDWVSMIIVILESGKTASESKLLRASKFGKVSRVARGSRALRLPKTIERVSVLLDIASSDEWITVIVKIFCLILVILLINHYIACAWYGIAAASTKQHTWIEAQMIEHLDIFDKYVYSIHWALTQFTPCTNNIAPANSTERLFASFVVLFALVVFSTFLSSLTSSIVQVKKLTFERYNEEVRIRDYLHEKSVSLDLASQVWHYYRRHYCLRGRILQESDIPFFSVMPKSLRRDIRGHVHMPTLANHPVFNQLIKDDAGRSMGLFLSDNVSTLIPHSGQDVFLEGDIATQMYFVVNGIGMYRLCEADAKVQAPDYMTEAVLWLSGWRHPGCLTVTNNRCELLLLDAEDFLACLETNASEQMIRVLRKYALLFLQQLHDVVIDSLADVFVGLNAWAGLEGLTTQAHNEERHSVEVQFSDLPLEKHVQDRMVVKAFKDMARYSVLCHTLSSL